MFDVSVQIRDLPIFERLHFSRTFIGGEKK
jgi:hypothetical protein